MTISSFQDNEIVAFWDEVFSMDKYHLRLVEIQDKYPQERSIFVEFADIDAVNGAFAEYLLEKPDRCLRIGKNTIRSNHLSAGWNQEDDVNLRIIALPKDARIDIRNLRSKHLNKLVTMEGLVRKATLPKLRMTNALYRCAKCDAEVWVPQRGMYAVEPLMCPNEGCNKTALRFSLDEAASVYADTQKIEIQENPEELRGGAQPERITGYVEDDITGKVVPGDRVTINGIIRPVEKGDRDKSTVFDVFVDVISFEFAQHEFDEVEITEEDEIKIIEMSKDPNFFDNLVHSISPTIYGMDREKAAVALQLFGGTHKEMDDKSSLRGDIHILLVGDPGVAKSQLLSYMSRLSPRGIYASGKSASAAGLCVDADTLIVDDQDNVEKIGDFVNARMTDPEEYSPGIWRQAISGVNIQSFGDFSVRYIPATYVWKIKTPDKLYKLYAGSATLTLTGETKIQAMKDGRFDWIMAKDLVPGDMAAIILNNMRYVPISEVEVLTENLPEFVYDLTMDPTHCFVGNGFAIHNTAAAVKDDFGDGRWTLEAGALVLADKGLACVDELDKMTDQDRSSLHEAMESQKIHVAKAGINATLQSRCSLLAAANPKIGRFVPNETIMNQINLPPALMSRFDLIFVMYDKPEQERDSRITEHMLKTHQRGQARTLQKNDSDNPELQAILDNTENIKPIYSIEMIRKYVSYAKRNCFPLLTDEAKDMIEKEFMSIRSKSEAGGSISITARQLEAYIRLSEASAKSRLSNRVEKIDADRAIDLIKYYMHNFQDSDGNYDVDLFTNEFSSKQRKEYKKDTDYVKAAIVSSANGASLDDIVKECETLSKEQIQSILDNLMNASQVYVTNDKKYKWVD